MDAFEVFANRALSSFYGRRWYKNSRNGTWVAHTELEAPNGDRRQLHVHSLLQGELLTRYPRIDIEDRLSIAWEIVAARKFLLTPKLDVRWVEGAREIDTVAAYIAKHVDSSLPTRDLLKTF